VVLETCVRKCCPSALLRRGSLLGECYSSVGSRLSVWCLRLRRLVILGGGRCCAMSFISRLTCFLIVKCNFVYVPLYTVGIFLKVKSDSES
jgi:hypothetical protein